MKSTKRKAPKSKPATFVSLAAEMAASFVSETRADGTPFTKLSPDAPAWIGDGWDGITGQCHKAIDSRGPDDWIYSMIPILADALTSYGDEHTPETIRDHVSEIADSQVDVYNADRYKWLASHLLNAGLVDEAVEELGHSDQGISGDIGQGQYRAYETIANTIIDFIERELEARA